MTFAPLPELVRFYMDPAGTPGTRRPKASVRLAATAAGVLGVLRRAFGSAPPAALVHST